MAEKTTDQSIMFSQFWSSLMAKITKTPAPNSASAPASSSFSWATSEASHLDIEASSEVPENALLYLPKIGPTILKSFSKIFSRKHEKGVDLELNTISINSPAATSSRSSYFFTEPSSSSSSSSSSSFTSSSWGASGRRLGEIIVNTPPSQEEVVSPSGWIRLHNLIKKGIETILPSADHQVFKTIKRLELAKHMLALSVPMVIIFITPATTSLVFKRLIIILISVAASLIMNGMLLSETYRRLAGFLEMIGIVLLLLAYFAFGFLILPGFLGIIPVVCFLISVIPFATAFCCRNNN